MAARITKAEVRERLRTVNSTVDIPDSILDSHAFITTGDAWLDQILSNSGYSYATMTTTQQTIAKAAEIAFVARRVVNAMPLPDSTKGPISVKDVTAQARDQMSKALKDEYEELLRVVGVEMSFPYVGDFGIDLLNADVVNLID